MKLTRTYLTAEIQMTIKYPDYERSILSVAASVLKHFGVRDCPYASLPEFDRELEKDPQNVIVMLFDGIGSDILSAHLPQQAFLRQKKACDVSSVFPPTTTAATTTLQSGLTPLEHSWMGWTLYFSELDENVFVFPNRLQKSGKKINGFNAAKTFMPYKSVFERIREASPSVQTHFIGLQAEERVFTLGAAMRKIKRLARRPGKKYIYLYWYQPDHAMHQNGVADPSITKMIKRINDSVQSMCAKLNNSVAAVIADHGLIDVKWAYLEDYPKLDGMLVRPPSIESRALSLFVKDGEHERFAELFNSVFGDSFVLMSKRQVYESGLFGGGTMGKRTDGFVGDFLAVATGELCIAANRRMPPLKGNHAGLTAAEMTVPFIVAKTLPD